MKKWMIGKPDAALSADISRKCSLSHLSSDVLVSRGIVTSEQAAVFFGVYGERDELGLYDPYDIADLRKAADIISEAAESGEKICIYGDYDCDGIMSTAALYNYLSETGADVSYFINERKDGYGLNADNIRKLHEQGIQLIITVDNGISAVEEARLCAELGIRLVITDHHTPPPELPQAEAVVDPHICCEENRAPFRSLCGCGVVMKLIAAMEFGESSIPVEMMSDLTAVATIGDIMPLEDENRVIVRHGMHYLEITGNIGMRALIEALSSSADGKKRSFNVNSRNIAFMVVPRINASGRMGSAMDAAELFTTEDEERAAELAAELCSLNEKRRSAENAIMEEAGALMNEKRDMFAAAPVIVIGGKGWHKGVIGITAAKICEKTGKPVFMISVDEEGHGTGSARAPEGYSVYDALYSCRELLTRFGGHKGAGGFSLDEKNIDAFREKLCSEAEGLYFEPTITAVKQLSPDELTVEAVEAMRRELEPFGEANPEPVFLLPNVSIINIKALSEGKYTGVTVNFGGNVISFPLFDTPVKDFPYDEGEIINIMGIPDINEFRDRKSVTLRVCDIRRSGVNQQKLLNAEREYNKFRGGAAPDPRLIPIMLPKREDYAAVYRAIPEDRAVSEDYIYNRFSGAYNLCMLHIIMDAFEETELISRDCAAGTIKRKKVENGRKADFAAAPTIKRLTM